MSGQNHVEIKVTENTYEEITILFVDFTSIKSKSLRDGDYSATPETFFDNAVKLFIFILTDDLRRFLRTSLLTVSSSRPFRATLHR